jgi:hypothetical protein
MEALQFIKDKYPQVIVKSIDLAEYKNTNALGFIISDNKLIVGYITKDGNLKKIMNPMDISQLDLDLVKSRIPRVYSASLDNLSTAIQNASASKKKKIDEKIFHEETVPLVIYNQLQKEYILVKQEHEDSILSILQDHKRIQENKQKCIDKINTDQIIITERIKEYIQKTKNLLLDKNKTIKETNEIWENVVKERDQLISRISLIKNETTDELHKQIENLTRSFTQEEFKTKFLQESFSKCTNTIKNEKTEIIRRIKEYKAAIKVYISNTDKTKLNETKKQMLHEFNIVKTNLDKLSEETTLDKSEIKSLSELNGVLNETITKNLLRISSQEDALNECEEKNNKLQQEIIKQDSEISKLNTLLLETKDLLNTQAIPITTRIDYNKCQNTLYTFVSLNNIFKRKLEIIQKIKLILDEKKRDYNTGDIQERFLKVSNDIIKYINFLDLEKYINSIYLDYFKNPSTINKVPESFCEELDNLIIYWNENVNVFKQQDIILTNIFEDLSNAVRVYIRIKPEFNLVQDDLKIEKDTVIINDKTFGPFYEIFDQTKTNFDIYTGANLPQLDSYRVTIPTESLNYKGLYNVFNQLQDGYNIMLFGYGISGSGKSHTLFGSNGVPGLINYGIGNLQDVSNIKVSNVFEQYNKLTNINFNQMTGQLIHLIGFIPQFSKFSKQSDFTLDIDIDNLALNNIETLINKITEYRKSQGRIRKTPNNLESSRSNLYIVFTITFTNGTVGNLTVIDNAGRESPIEIYEQFINTKLGSLPGIMSPSGGQELITKSLKPEYSEYTSEDVYKLLKEGFYINESLNHLIYFFNTKNNIHTNVYPQSSSLTKYDTTKYYISPKSESNSIKEANNCLTIPIMKYLDNLNYNRKVYKPSKFVMICNIRQEPVYYNSTISSLEFASSIKSS